MLCDTCGRSIASDGYELALLPGTRVSGQDSSFRHFTSATAGALSVVMCVPCGERITAILQQKLEAPCPTCEVGPAHAAARRGGGHRLQRNGERAA